MPIRLKVTSGTPSKQAAQPPPVAGTKRREREPAADEDPAEADPVDSGRSKRIQRSRAGRQDIVESVDRTRELGDQLLGQIRGAKDKSREIAELFLTLPDREELPDYYDEIVMPMAIEDIERSLEDGKYSIMSELEGDLLRMVANAKQFNERKSQVYEDAERIKKIVVSFMTEHNPAYRNPRYSGKPTPIPGGRQRANTASATAATPAEPTPKAEAVESSTPKPAESIPDKKAASPKKKGNTKIVKKAEPETKTDVAEDDSDSDNSWLPDFSGQTFTQAQETIINSLMGYVEPESQLDIYAPFVHLPPRSLTEYYKAIDHPVSLNTMSRKIKGIQGRTNTGTGTLFHNWTEFCDEAAYIWKNARKFNELDSDIVLLVGELEEHFGSLVEAAREQVPPDSPEPEQPGAGPAPKLPRLKLKGPPKPSIKLRLARREKESSAPAPPARPGSKRGRSTSHQPEEEPEVFPSIELTPRRSRRSGSKGGATPGRVSLPRSSRTPAASESRSRHRDTPPAQPNFGRGSSRARDRSVLHGSVVEEDPAAGPGEAAEDAHEGGGEGGESGVEGEESGEKGADEDAEKEEPAVKAPEVVLPPRINPNPFDRSEAGRFRQPGRHALLHAVTLSSGRGGGYAPHSRGPPRAPGPPFRLHFPIVSGEEEEEGEEEKQAKEEAPPPPPPPPPALFSATAVVSTPLQLLEIVPTVPVAAADQQQLMLSQSQSQSQSTAVAGGPEPRPHRIIVLVNGQPAQQVARSSLSTLSSLPSSSSSSLSSASAAASASASASAVHDLARPVFEGRVVPGMVNKVEVEVLAGPAQARSTSRVARESVQWEKAVVWVFVTR